MTDSSERRREARASDASDMSRTFIDADGIRWHVHEQAFSEYDRRRGISLIFASEAAVRRVRDYPADWCTLTDAELAELSWKA
jgi:hypothetical protein